MDPHKLIAQHNISAADIDLIRQHFERRVTASGWPRQAAVLLDTAALDLALGAIEMSQETQSAMGEALTARQLLALLSGVDLAPLSS